MAHVCVRTQDEGKSDMVNKAIISNNYCKKINKQSKQRRGKKKKKSHVLFGFQSVGS
jgi:hypothetical protein